MHLTKIEHQELQDKISNGERSLSIPRNVARQFYAKVSNKAIMTTTGDSAIVDKSLVITGLILSPIFLGLCLLHVIYEFGWWATISAPLIGLFWAVLTGLTNEEGEWYIATVLTGFAIAAAILEPNGYTIPLATFVVSIWVNRVTYIVAERQLVSLVSSSYAAYDMLADHIEIEEISG